MAATKKSSLNVMTIGRGNSRGAAEVVLGLVVLLVQEGQVGAQQTQMSSSCSAGLNNLNVCAPFVVPGFTNTSPSSDCCTALQSVEHDCLCNTLRVIARLPSQCNLPTLSCGN